MAGPRWLQRISSDKSLYFSVVGPLALSIAFGFFGFEPALDAFGAPLLFVVNVGTSR